MPMKEYSPSNGECAPRLIRQFEAAAHQGFDDISACREAANDERSK